MIGEKPSVENHHISYESAMNDCFHKATSLQQQDPEQALLFVEQLTDLATKAQNSYYLAIASKIRGNVHFLQGENQIAKEHYSTAEIQAKKVDDPKLKGDIYYNLGRVNTNLKDYPQALKHLQKSLTYRRKLTERKDEISSLNHIGQVYWDLQSYQESAKYFQAATQICDASSNARQMASLYNNLGNALLKMDETTKALEAYTKSLKLKETLGDATELATAKLNLGNLYYTSTDYRIALGYYLDAEKMYHEVGDRNKEAIVFSNVGATYNALKDFEQAEQYHFKAYQYFQGNDMKESLAKTLNSMGTIHHHKAEYQKAIRTYQESLNIKSSFYNSESLAITYNNLSDCYYCLGEYQIAMDFTQKSMEYSNQIKSKSLLLKNYSMLGRIYAALKDYQNAYEALNVHRLLDLEMYDTEKSSMLAEMMALYDAEGKTRQIEILKSEHHALEELFLRQAKDKIRYLKLYRSKLEEVKKRVAIQKKLKQLNADLESKIQKALQDYQAQQQVLIQKSKLESLGVMAAGMAHEINQPLSAITMGLSNLRLKAQKSELTEAYFNDKIGKLSDDIQRIRSVIEHVRQFSRDQVNSTPEQIDIQHTIQAAVDLIAYDLAKHQIKLKMDFPSHPLTTVGSKFKLEQVFVNLITNARDAILERKITEGHAQPEYRIEITAHRRDKNAEIVFWDNGIGVPESCLGKLFDPFFTTKSPEKGTGLGLSISYGIILEMGGKIWVNSSQGQFTKINISLPILAEKKI